MKKFIYLIMAFSLTLISCDPMGDVYDELDASGTTTDPRNIIGSIHI